MSRTKSVTFEEFLILVKFAQTQHSNQKEPIPQIQEGQYEKIKSCLNTPFQTYGNKQLYKGFYTKAAVLFYLLNKNHALINGNKRMACLTMAYFCAKNKHPLRLTPEEFYNLARSVTESPAEDMETVIKHIEKAIKITEG